LRDKEHHTGADFFIGAHAAALGISILTRDKGRYTTYFPQVRLICA
jgi:predicted nucleic acid-binding protein